jgi:hypothetical protein
MANDLTNADTTAITQTQADKPSVENQTFQDDAILVDGNQYRNCVFIDTTLIYEGGKLPTFVNCQFRGVDLQFAESAANTLKFLSGLNKGGFQAAVDAILKGVRS